MVAGAGSVAVKTGPAGQEEVFDEHENAIDECDFSVSGWVR